MVFYWVGIGTMIKAEIVFIYIYTQIRFFFELDTLHQIHNPTDVKKDLFQLLAL